VNRRDFISFVPFLTVVPSALASSTPQRRQAPITYSYFVNCYIQNQKYWPLEEYKKGVFGGDHATTKDEGFMGDKWINGQLRFCSFQRAVEFIEVHVGVVEFETEIAYEVFHERSQDPLVAPKHIYNYWATLNPHKETKWIHPDYIDHTADGALIEYVK